MWTNIQNYFANIHCVSKESSHLYTLCNFSQILTDFQYFALLESVRNLLQNPYNITHLTLGMLLHYLGKLKSQFSVDIQQKWKKNANKVAF